MLRRISLFFKGIYASKHRDCQPRKTAQHSANTREKA